MTSDASSVEHAVSRALRDNLDGLQRTAEELRQAVADLVAACASNRPSNALPPMLRAQTAAASLAAALEVLSRFITAALQPAQRSAAEEEVVRLVGVQPPEPAPPMSPPPRSIPVPMGEAQASAPGAEEVVLAEAPQEAEGVTTAPAEAAPAEAAEEQWPVGELLGPFDLASLPPQEQELHRRANRVAKVSMQDITMLHPEQVRLGRENKDLCVRLRDDIEKAHKEYDRRFRAIMGHPVDYFYHWMVEILAEGDPEALGGYPYPSPVLRR